MPVFFSATFQPFHLYLSRRSCIATFLPALFLSNHIVLSARSYETAYRYCQLNIELTFMAGYDRYSTCTFMRSVGEDCGNYSLSREQGRGGR